jgi:hypothetical protein
MPRIGHYAWNALGPTEIQAYALYPKTWFRFKSPSTDAGQDYSTAAGRTGPRSAVGL